MRISQVNNTHPYAYSICADGSTLDIETIIQKVFEHYKLNPLDAYGYNRNHDVSNARQICMYLAKHLLKMNNTEMGKLMRRDRSTIIHGVDTVANRMEVDDDFCDIVSCLQNELLALQNVVGKKK